MQILENLSKQSFHTQKIVGVPNHKREIRHFEMTHESHDVSKTVQENKSRHSRTNKKHQREITNARKNTSEYSPKEEVVVVCLNLKPSEPSFNYHT